MFMGHYGVSFAAPAVHRRLPLWLLFVAVQWLDIWWAILTMAGVEKFRIVPHLAEASWLDLYDIHYTHSLAGAVALSLLLGGICAAVWGPRGRTFLVVALAAFSHWLLDLVVHLPDLPLWGNGHKVGFGLWHYLWLSFPLELVVLWVGALVYAHYMKATSAFRASWLWLFVAALTFEEVNVTFGLFGPFFADPKAIAALSLAIYLIVALLAGLTGLTRRPASPPVSTAA
jgi:hypothetical protein